MSADQRLVILGVDTGGTYTDAVLYEQTSGRLLGKAKAPTDHDDLARGFSAVVDAVLASAGIAPQSVSMVALSTTLATNALVEGRGRPAGLVMIGFEPEASTRGGLGEAVGSDPVIMVEGGHTPHGEEVAPLDTARLLAELDVVAPRVEAFAVTGQFSVRNPEHEQLARDLIREHCGLPVTCSHELAEALNGPKRSVTAVLNARLVAMIDELMTTTGDVLRRRGIDAPLMVVRGNGSLVSSEFVRERPVETILSGPAASLVGAAHLTGLGDALVADIGGTTTDVAILHDGLPEFGGAGAVVGGHHTMVEAVRMRTHGLGGDSEVWLAEDEGPRLVIGPRRVVPLVAVPDTQRDRIEAALRRQLSARPGIGGATLGYVTPTGRTESARLDRKEREVVERVGDGAATDDVVHGSLDRRALHRLVGRGVLRATGFTPTDACHVLGTQQTHDPALARLGAALWARRVDRKGNPFAASAEEFASSVVAALVRRSAEVLLGAALERDGLPADAADHPLVAAALDGTTKTARLVAGLAVPLVGLGAPAPTYYPAVGDVLGAEIFVPEHADVANAIGAAVAKVRLRHQVVITSPRRGIYRVHTGRDPKTAHALETARALATEHAQQWIREEMVAAGARDFELDSTWQETTVEIEGRAMFIEGVVTVTGAGPPRLHPDE